MRCHDEHVPLQEVDVVVLTWNDGPLLDRAVGSAVESREVHVHVFVVDNGSAVAPDLAGRDVKPLRLPRNVGVATGRTFGASLGTAPLICFLDSDAELRPDTLARLVAVLERRPDAALVSPVFDGQSPSSSGGPAPRLSTKLARGLLLRSTYGAGRVGEDGCLEVDFTIGACQLFRRSAWEQVGGLDTRYFYGPEDVDFCLRLRQAGWSILQDPAVVCIHPARRRFKNPFTRRGFQHAVAVALHLWRHRRWP